MSCDVVASPPRYEPPPKSRVSRRTSLTINATSKRTPPTFNIRLLLPDGKERQVRGEATSTIVGMRATRAKETREYLLIIKVSLACGGGGGEIDAYASKKSSNDGSGSPPVDLNDVISPVVKEVGFVSPVLRTESGERVRLDERFNVESLDGATFVLEECDRKCQGRVSFRLLNTIRTRAAS